MIRRRRDGQRRGMWLDWTMVAIAFVLALIVGQNSAHKHGPTADTSDDPAASSSQ